jgi:hypothetical protein
VKRQIFWYEYLGIEKLEGIAKCRSLKHQRNGPF